MKKLIPFLLILLALTAAACGGDSSGDDGGGGEASSGLPGADIEDAEVDGAAVTYEGSEISFANPVVSTEGQEHFLLVDAVINVSGEEPELFPLVHFVCNATAVRADAGMAVEGRTANYVQPGEFTTTFKLQIPTDMEPDFPECGSDGYVDVRYGTTGGGFSHLFSEDLKLIKFQLSQTTIDEINAAAYS